MHLSFLFPAVPIFSPRIEYLPSCWGLTSSEQQTEVEVSPRRVPVFVDALPSVFSVLLAVEHGLQITPPECIWASFWDSPIPTKGRDRQGEGPIDFIQTWPWSSRRLKSWAQVLSSFFSLTASAKQIIKKKLLPLKPNFTFLWVRKLSSFSGASYIA